MVRNILLILVVVAGYFAAVVPFACADVPSAGRPANAHRRVLAPARRHVAARARSSRERATQVSRAHTSSKIRTSHSAPVSRNRSRARGARSRFHPRLKQDADAAAPVAEAISLHRDRILPPSTLRGSFESLARQNERADSDGLERILDEDDLADRIAQKLLVPVPASAALTVNDNLPENRKYCRPWTAKFLADLARAHVAKFGHPIEVSSAVRTVEYQKHLKMTNGNAAAAEGDVVSPHLTGATIDVAKRDMGRAELSWMRGWLLQLQRAGTIDVEEEFRQRCFHISVYKNYASPPPAPLMNPHSPQAPSRAQVAASGL